MAMRKLTNMLGGKVSEMRRRRRAGEIINFNERFISGPIGRKQFSLPGVVVNVASF